jgi:hypothetical protein
MKEKGIVHVPCNPSGINLTHLRFSSQIGKKIHSFFRLRAKLLFLLEKPCGGL